MKFTLRSLIEFILGLILVIAAVVIGLNEQEIGSLTDLLLGLLSLGGILVMAHAIWLMRRKEQ